MPIPRLDLDFLKHLTAPCPACVSEYGKVDPKCPYCHGTGRG